MSVSVLVSVFVSLCERVSLARALSLFVCIYLFNNTIAVTSWREIIVVAVYAYAYAYIIRIPRPPPTTMVRVI